MKIAGAFFMPLYNSLFKEVWMRKKSFKSQKKLGIGFIRLNGHQFNTKIEIWRPSKKSGGKIAA